MTSFKVALRAAIPVGKSKLYIRQKGPHVLIAIGNRRLVPFHDPSKRLKGKSLVVQMIMLLRNAPWKLPYSASIHTRVEMHTTVRKKPFFALRKI